MTAVSVKPLPIVMPWARRYFRAAAQGHLELQYCVKCCRFIFFPRVVCPSCLRDSDITWRRASGRGTIYTFAIVHRPQHSSFLGDVPITTAVVSLEEGPYMITELVGVRLGEVRIGARCEATFEKRSDDIGIVKFLLRPERG